MATEKQIRPAELPIIMDSFEFFSQCALHHPKPDPIANILSTPVSCGVSYVYGLDDPKSTVDKVLKMRRPTDYKKIREAFVIFSDVDREDGKTSGEKLYKYIQDNKLGNIGKFGPRMNPNTGNPISVYVWEPPHESLYPKDRHMEIFGKVIKRDSYGDFSGYEYVDARFQDGRTTGSEA